jgi:hypothetical protein
MGASICRDAPVMLTNDRPTTWRYLLHAHGGQVDASVADAIARRFNSTPEFVVGESDQPHHHSRITRKS